MIYGIVKLFGTTAHAEEFLCGRLYMNSLEYFRSLEEAGQRGDSDEGVQGWLQPHRIGTFKIGDSEIDPRDLAGPVKVRREDTSDWNVFCALSITDRGFEAGVSGKNLADFVQAVRIPAACAEFGANAVLVHQLGAFLDRVTSAIRRDNLRGSLGPVEYFDPREHHGGFAEDRIPFFKRKDFEHQREYRIAVHRPGRPRGPYVLDVGDLSDVALRTTLDGFNQQLSARLPDGSTA